MILIKFAILFFLVLMATIIAILVRGAGRASGENRTLPARFRESFLNVVPKPVRTTASVIVFGAALIGLTVGIVETHVGTPFAGTHNLFYILWAIFGIAGGLFIGGLFAIWILGLGYIWADARRRDMPYIPWTLLAAIVPNLLGFLLYFVLRKPLASPCPQCGMPIAAEQRFCPMCGFQALSQPPLRTAPPAV
ncbi:MAG: zinc ribbon domain-containing protein [Acidobacteriaceae bacterium]|jgi:hypothetical protein